MKQSINCMTYGAFEYYMRHDMEPCKYCEHFHVEWMPGINYSEHGATCSAKVSCDLKKELDDDPRR